MSNLIQQLVEHRKQLELSGKSKEEIKTLSQEYTNNHLLSEWNSIKNECEEIGHSVIVIDNTDGTIIVAPNNATSIHYCEYCRKVIDPV